MIDGQGADQRWSVDFVHEVLAGSRRFRVFAVVDDFSRQPGTTELTADRVVRDIRRKTRKRHSAEEKIRFVLRRALERAAPLLVGLEPERRPAAGDVAP